MNALDLMNSLSVIYDPRQQWKIEHQLTDVLILIICAVIAGCEGWEEIEDFGNERLDWLKNENWGQVLILDTKENWGQVLILDTTIKIKTGSAL